MTRALFCIGLLSCIFVGTINGLVGKVCHTEAECDAGECCQILSEFLIASKRDLVQGVAAPAKTGTCQLYRKEGDSCSSIEKINGYCGCGPNLECNSYEVPIPSYTTAHPRRMVNRRGQGFAKPGYMWISKCEKI